MQTKKQKKIDYFYLFPQPKPQKQGNQTYDKSKTNFSGLSPREQNKVGLPYHLRMKKFIRMIHMAK